MSLAHATKYKKKRPPHLKRPFFEFANRRTRFGSSVILAPSGRLLGLLLLLRRYGSSIARHPLRVILDERFLTTVTVRSIEIEIQHLLINLAEVPVIIIEPVNGAHYTSAMTAAGAVHIELTGFGSIDKLEELSDLRVSRI